MKIIVDKFKCPFPWIPSYNKLGPILCALLMYCSGTFGQQIDGTTLSVTHHSTFSTLPTFPIQCLKTFYKDSRGKLWFESCQISNTISASGLFSFDGYAFKPVKPHNPVVSNTTKTYIGLVNDRIYGYSNLKDISYLYYYDIATNRYHVYDSIPRPFPAKAAINGINSSKGYNLVQVLKDNTIYTYIRQADEVQLHIYNKYLEKTNYPAVDISTTPLEIVKLSANQYKEWYIQFNPYSSTFYLYNLKTGLRKRVKTPVDLAPLGIYYECRQIGNLLILSFVKAGKNSAAIFSFEKEDLNKMTYLRTVDKAELYYSFFVDNKGQSLSYIKDENQRKLEVRSHDGITYDVSDVLDFVKDSQILQVSSDDFTKEINILTKRDFVVSILEKANAYKQIQTYANVRGIDLLNEKELIYLKGGDKPIEQVVNLITGEINSKPMVCGFNSEILHRQNGKIWGVASGDIASYDTSLGICSRYQIEQQVREFAFVDANHIIFMDTSYQFWKYTLSDKNVEPLLHDGKPLRLDFSSTLNYADFLIDKNILWIASPDGLYRYDLSKELLKKMSREIKGLDYNYISIAKGYNKDLCLGTYSSGLLIINTEDYTFKHLNTESGLPNNTIASVTKDNKGYYWVATYNGVAVVNTKGEIIRNLYESDGLIHNEANRYSAKLLPDGRLAIGTITGITLINPQEVTQNFGRNNNLQTYLTSIEYFDESDNKLVNKTESLYGIDNLELPPEENHVVLEFGTNNFINPERNNYFYKIEDLDENWKSLGSRPYLNLTSLPPGKHILKVRANDGVGHWSTNPLQLQLDVKQFFYKQVWFYVLIFGFVMLLAVITIIILKRQIKKATKKMRKDKEKIEHQSKRLIQLDKTKSDFFTNITHEFRTPLTVIKGITQLIKSKYPDALQKELYDIEYHSEELLGMVNQILDLRKLESNQIKLKPVHSDLVMYIDYIVDSHYFLAKSKGIVLRFIDKPEGIFMDFDPDKIKIILTNIIANAIKYSIDGGSVTVTADKDKNSKVVSIRVQDTGEGLSESELKHIFKLFYQTDQGKFKKEIGSGIGLYYTKKLVDLMDGKIYANSVRNEGTTFTIQLPIANVAKSQGFVAKKDSTEDSLTEPNTHTHFSTKPYEYKLLIVDDNASIRSLLQAQLYNYNLIFAKDGAEGIDKAKKEVPDLIISDVMMPKKDGFELCKTLKSDLRTSHIPIILLTAKTDHISTIEGLEVKADVYLKKPFNYDELELQVKNLIEGRKKLQNNYKNSLPTSHPKEDILILKIKSLILKNMSNSDFGILDLCEELKLSRSTLHDKLKALTGLSTSNFINYVRLQKAKELLETTTQNVTEITDEVGIKNLTYFSTLFKNQYGISPSKYRQHISE